MSNDWQATSFAVKTDRGEYLVAGWVHGLFALDFRVRDRQPGWQLTHIPTGMQGGFIEAPLEDAFAVVAEVEALGDWSAVTGANVSDDIKRGMLRLRDERRILLRSADVTPLKYSPRVGERVA